MVVSTTYSSLRIAHEFVQLAKEYKCKDLTTLKLLKLVYMAHGQSLAILDRPLIWDAIEAWKYGPVIPTLYHHIKGQYENVVKKIEISGVDLYDVDMDEPLDEWAADLVREVFDQLHDKKAPQLSTVTHREGSPWSLTMDGGRVVIADDLTKEYYRNNRLDGRPWGYRPKLGKVVDECIESDKRCLVDCMTPRKVQWVEVP